MGKKIEPLKDAPELPEEVAGPIEPEEILELDDTGDGPMDDKLTDLLEQATAEEQEVSDDSESPADTAKTKESGVDAKEAEKSDTEDGIVEDEKLDEAIEDIVAKEADTVLAAEDKAKSDIDDEESADQRTAKKKPGKFKKFFADIWNDPRKRWATLSGVVFVVLALAVVPHSRYFILNSLSIRSSLSLKVIDSDTLQPLKNVNISAGGAQAVTDSDGQAKLENVRLGDTTLRIEKRAFSEFEKQITVGWGSNPLGDFQATAVGAKYTFIAKDAFSGQPLTEAEAASGEGNAHADENGELVLVLDTADQEDTAQLSVQISAEGYRTEEINITVNNKETQEVQMVPGRRHVFVSKRSGNYDVYAVDADGKNEERIVGGTGLERSDIALVPHPSDSTAALVATRENTRNQNGYLLSTLYIVNTVTGDLMKVDQSEQIKIVGWSKGGHLVYVKIAAGASGTDPKRHRLMSFNSKEITNKEIASSNSFNDVVMAGGRVYYAPSNIFQEATPAVYAVNPDGGNQEKLLDKEVYTIVRTGYDSLSLGAGDEWYSYTLGSPMAAKAEGPSSTTGRVYLDAPNSKFSLWVDDRDGKGVLLNYDKTSREEKALFSHGGLKLPAYWLNDKYVVFRISDSRETADYVMNVEGGEPQKITDVTDTTGITRWFYY